MAADKVLGIDIGAHSVKVAQVTRTDDGLVVDGYTAVRLVPGCIIDGQVVVSKRAHIVEALRTAVTKSGLFSTKDAVIGFNNPSSVFFSRTTIPAMTEENLRKSLSNIVEAADTGLDVAHQQMDFSVLSKTPRSGKIEAMLYIVQDSFAETICEIAEEAGLRIVGADLSVLATLRGAGIDLDQTRAQAVINIGADTQTVLVHSGGVPLGVYPDTSYTGNEATRIIADVMGLDPDDEEVEQLKVSGERFDEEVTEVVSDYLKNTALRVESSLTAYLRSGPDMPPVASILLAGGGSMLQGLARAIHTKTNIPVQYARPDEAYKGDLRNAVFHLTALGLTTGAQA